MHKPFKFLLASGNAHKAEELSELFNSEVIAVSAAPEKIEVDEDGETFQANALKKAEAYFHRFKQPVVADDSGLVVAALPNDLGVHSARFGGDGLTDQDRYELLLKKMDGVEDRKAYFACHLCFYLSPKEIYFFEGRLKGSIGFAPAGNHGFGYDPVFIPEKIEDNSTFAENPGFKAKHSHRAVACQHAESFFSGLNESVDKS